MTSENQANDTIFNELSAQNFDVIRFSSYRVASKLRYIQKRTNFILVDLWNTIEAIRENGLHTFQDIHSEVSYSKLETLISSIFYQLNKRLPPSQHINLDDCISNLTVFLTSIYDQLNIGKVKVFSIKIALATLCFGKISDKLKYIYSLLSDQTNGQLISTRFNAFLKELLALPIGVFETGSYQYDDTLSTTIFDFSHPITINEFMSIFFNSGYCPPSLSWFIILDKMSEVELITHSTQCSACHRSPFTGFRYKCQKCFNYTLCQDCFWRGRVSGSHNADTHPCKEYTYWKSSSKELSRSFRKSFRCLPANKSHIEFEEEVPKSRRLNLTHIVPPSPIPSVHPRPFDNGHNSLSPDVDSVYSSGHRRTASGIYHNDQYDTFSRSSTLSKSPYSTNFIYDTNKFSPGLNADEEHRLIALYASKLNNKSGTKLHTNAEISPDYNYQNDRSLISSNSLPLSSSSSSSLKGVKLSPQSSMLKDLSKQQKIITELEFKNREIMKEIQRLKQEEKDVFENKQNYQSTYYQDPMMKQNQDIQMELIGLRQRKHELEYHLNSLHESRKELLAQLDSLMKLLNKNDSLFSSDGATPPPQNRRLSATGFNSQSSIGSSPKDNYKPTAATSAANNHQTPADLTVNYQSFLSSGRSSPKALTNSINHDLLLAADSVTNTVGSLVDELKSDDINQAIDEILEEENKEKQQIQLIEQLSKHDQLESDEIDKNLNKDLKAKEYIKLPNEGDEISQRIEKISLKSQKDLDDDDQPFKELSLKIKDFSEQMASLNACISSTDEDCDEDEANEPDEADDADNDDDDEEEDEEESYLKTDEDEIEEVIDEEYFWFNSNYLLTNKLN